MNNLFNYMFFFGFIGCGIFLGIGSLAAAFFSKECIFVRIIMFLVGIMLVGFYAGFVRNEFAIYKYNRRLKGNK